MHSHTDIEQLTRSTIITLKQEQTFQSLEPICSLISTKLEEKKKPSNHSHTNIEKITPSPEKRLKLEQKINLWSKVGLLAYSVRKPWRFPRASLSLTGS